MNPLAGVCCLFLENLLGLFLLHQDSINLSFLGTGVKKINCILGIISKIKVCRHVYVNQFMLHLSNVANVYDKGNSRSFSSITEPNWLLVRMLFTCRLQTSDQLLRMQEWTNLRFSIRSDRLSTAEKLKDSLWFMDINHDTLTSLTGLRSVTPFQKTGRKTLNWNNRKHSLYECAIYRMQNFLLLCW